MLCEFGIKWEATLRRYDDVWAHRNFGGTHRTHGTGRQLQDETNGFTAFISWTFQPDNTPLSDIQPLGSYEYLKVQAISRLYLDNVPNIQSSWVTQGLKIGQLAFMEPMIWGA